MKIDILNFIKSSIEGLGLAILFLVLGLLFVPDKIIILLVKKVKPKILKSINSFFVTIAGILVTNNYNFSEQDNTINTSLENIKNKNLDISVLENNLFIIDSLIGIFEMLSYILYKDNWNSELYENTCEYFLSYCRSLYKKIQLEMVVEIQEHFYTFNDRLYEIREKYKIESSDTKAQKEHKYDSMYKIQRKYADEFYAFLVEKQKGLASELEESKKDLVISVGNILEVK